SASLRCRTRKRRCASSASRRPIECVARWAAGRCTAVSNSNLRERANALPVPTTPAASALGTASGVSQRLPGAAVLGTGDALRNEIHTVNAVVRIWVQTFGAVYFLAGGAGHHVGIGSRINVRKGLQKRFRVAARQPARRLGGVAQVGGIW